MAILSLWASFKAEQSLIFNLGACLPSVNRPRCINERGDPDGPPEFSSPPTCCSVGLYVWQASISANLSD